MSTTPPPYEAPFFVSVRQWGITRGENGVLGGVIEGVGHRIGMDRIPARLIAIVLAILTSGLFLTAYAAAWVILPDANGRIIAQDFGRGAPNVPALIGIAVIGLIGLNGLAWTGPHWGWVGATLATLVGLSIVAGIIALIVWAVVRDDDGRAPTIADFRGGPGSAEAKAKMNEAKAKMREAKNDMRDAARAMRDDANYVGAKIAEGGKATGEKVAEGAKATGAVIAEEGKATARRAKAAAAEIRDAVVTRSVAPPQPPVPPVPPVPPLPPRMPYRRPRVPGPGHTIRSLAFAAALLAAAAIWLLNRQNLLNVRPVEAWFAAAVIIVGLAIIAAGAAGRRIGVFGFYAVVLVVGWGFRMVAGDDLEQLIESHEVLVGEHGLRIAATDPGTVTCRDFDEVLASRAAENRIEAWDSDLDVTVYEATATIVVPRDATVTLENPGGNLTGSVSWLRMESGGKDSRFATCEVDGPSSTFYTAGEEPIRVNVTIYANDVNIVIEER